MIFKPSLLFNVLLLLFLPLLSFSQFTINETLGLPTDTTTNILASPGNIGALAYSTNEQILY